VTSKERIMKIVLALDGDYIDDIFVERLKTAIMDIQGWDDEYSNKVRKAMKRTLKYFTTTYDYAEFIKTLKE